MLYDDIVSALGKAVKDPGYRDKLLKDPNGTLKAEGADLGNSVTTLEWVESTNCLNVHVASSAAISAPSAHPAPVTRVRRASPPATASVATPSVT